MANAAALKPAAAMLEGPSPSMPTKIDMKNNFTACTIEQLEQAAANQVLIDGWKYDRIMEEIERRKIFPADAEVVEAEDCKPSLNWFESDHRVQVW